MLSEKRNHPDRNKVLDGLKVCSGNCDEKNVLILSAATNVLKF